MSQENIRKWEKFLKEATDVSNQAAAFNRCVNKVHDDRLFFNDMIGKSSQKTEKIVAKLWDLSAFSVESPCNTWNHGLGIFWCGQI